MISGPGAGEPTSGEFHEKINADETDKAIIPLTPLVHLVLKLEHLGAQSVKVSVHQGKLLCWRQHTTRRSAVEESGYANRIIGTLLYDSDTQ